MSHPSCNTTKLNTYLKEIKNTKDQLQQIRQEKSAVYHRSIVVDGTTQTDEELANKIAEEQIIQDSLRLERERAARADREARERADREARERADREARERADRERTPHHSAATRGFPGGIAFLPVNHGGVMGVVPVPSGAFPGLPPGVLFGHPGMMPGFPGFPHGVMVAGPAPGFPRGGMVAGPAPGFPVASLAPPLVRFRR